MGSRRIESSSPAIARESSTCELFQRIDLSLDTVPYNGHTTSLDSLWMGVPVVTLVGETVVGRAGMSQSTNLGLTELITRTPGDYVATAVRLAGDLDCLISLRRTLRSRMVASPLMDADTFHAQRRGRVSRNVAQLVCRRVRLSAS